MTGKLLGTGVFVGCGGIVTAPYIQHFTQYLKKIYYLKEYGGMQIHIPPYNF